MSSSSPRRAFARAGFAAVLLLASSGLAGHGARAADHPTGAAELDCLTQAVYYEARGESPEGQAAVAQVVLNRTRDAHYPRSVCAVIRQGAESSRHGGCQFSFVCAGAPFGRREPHAWAKSRAIAARVLAGARARDIGQAIAFHVARLGRAYDGGLKRVARIGGHVFLARFVAAPAAASAKTS